MLAICGSRSARPCLAGTKIANWDAAIYCAGRRDLLVVGEIKRSLRSDAGSIDLRPDTVFLVPLRMFAVWVMCECSGFSGVSLRHPPFG
jgi:hypothetical protein